jgi:hypothetical protein
MGNRQEKTGIQKNPGFSEKAGVKAFFIFPSRIFLEIRDFSG